MNQRRIGLEYEFLAVNEDTGLAATRDQMKAIWRDWGGRKHVETYIDSATRQPVGVLYAQSDGSTIIINTDAGVDIVEFGFAPFATLHECDKNMREIMAEFLAVAAPHGIRLMAYGLQPKTPCFFPDLKTEKIWYRGFGRLPHFARGHHTFHNIAAHQPCIDVEYEELIPALNVLNGLGAVTIALFANSGVGEWREQAVHEVRERRWNMWVDWPDPLIKKIAGIPAAPFQSFRDYLAYNWSVGLPAVHRGKTLHTIEPVPVIETYLQGASWESFDVGEVRPSAVIPEMADVNLLNQYIWIQSRPKFFFDEAVPLAELLEAYRTDGVDEFAKKHLTKLYVETRNIACQPWSEIMAAPAYVLGIIENLESASAVLSERPWSEWIALREEAIKTSLETPGIDALVKRMIMIADAGLRKRGQGEERYLQPLFARVEAKESPAVRAMRTFRDGGIEALIDSNLIPLEV